MIREAWFDILITVGLREQHRWLASLPARVKRIANFGCWSGCEPFALMWTLDASEVMVVEKEEEYIEELNNQFEIVSHRFPESLQGRVINSICRDMTQPIPELIEGYFDLAYCENVLYNLPIQRGSDALERGIWQMIRVVKPDGFIVAIEPKIGAQFETQSCDFFGKEISLPVRISEPEDISHLFSSGGHRKLVISGCPPYSYCYQKKVH
jgi:SAM-dependent methyltransferase